MLLSCDGRRPSIPLVALVAAASLLSAGCASKTQTRTYAQMDAPSYDNLGRKPQMEDDGLPAQIAPPRRAAPRSNPTIPASRTAATTGSPLRRRGRTRPRWRLCEACSRTVRAVPRTRR